MANEIKKAFEQFKKELFKETGIKGGFTMSARQIENRTATYCICNLIPYEKEIAYHQNACERVRSYDSWTDAEKDRWCAGAEKTIAYYKDQLAKYGTKENYAAVMFETITKSKAYRNLCETFGGVRTYLEQKRNSGLDVMYIRFTYFGLR